MSVRTRAYSRLQNRPVSIYLSLSDTHLTSCHIFQSDSSVTITCANGKWNKQVSCEPVDCGLPDKYHVHPAHFDFPEGTTYGKKSTFQCREPAQLVGEEHSGACTHAATDTYFLNIIFRAPQKGLLTPLIGVGRVSRSLGLLLWK